MSDVSQHQTIPDHYLRTLLDTSPVGMLVFNHREEMLFANPPAERLFGLIPEHHSASRCGDAIRCANRLHTEQGCGHADACPNCPLFRGLRATIAGTATPADQEGETLLDREPGCTPLWIRFKIRPLIIDGKQGAILTVDDITALRQTEQQYATLFREMLNAFALHEIVCDDQGRPVDYRFLAVNPAFERMTGLDAGQIGGRTVLEVLPGIDDSLIETYGRVALSGKPAHFEYFSREIGKHFAINAFCPRPGQFACLFEDITERKQAREALAQSEVKHRSAYTLLRSLCDNVPDMIWAKDLDNRYLFANTALCRDLLNAADTEEPLGKSHLFFAERERARHLDQPQWHTFSEFCGDSDAATKAAGLPMRFDEFGNIRGQFRFLDVHKAPFLDENGTMIGTVGSARDVTAVKAMEQELKDREQRLDLAIRGAELATWDWHIPSGTIAINDRWAEMLGYTVDEVEPCLESWSTRLHPDDHGRVQAALTRHLTGEADHYESEYRLRHRSGEWIWVMDRGRVLERDAQGKPLRACGTRFDVSRQKILIEQSRDGIVILDGQGRVREANRRFADMLGYTMEEVQHLHVWDWDAQWTQEDLLQKIELLDAAGNFFETIHRRKNGTTYPVEISSNGSICGGEKLVFCVCRDISERKRIEDTLREQEIFLRSMTTSTRDAILVMDFHGRVAFWNPAATTIFGYEEQEALGTHLHRLIAPQHYHQAYERAFLAFQQTGRGMAINRTHELEARHKSGREFPIELSLAAFPTAKGWHTVGVVRDISERKKAEEALRHNEQRLRKLVDILQHPAGQVQEFLDHSLEQALELTNSTMGFFLRYQEERRECTVFSWSGEIMVPCAMASQQTTFSLERAGLWGEAIRRRQPVIINDFAADHPLKQGFPEGHVELRRFMAVPIIKDDCVVGVVGLADKTSAYDQNDALQVSLLMDSVYNIAERKRMEEERSRLQAQLVQAQKMQAIGTLAGGIAHDFNNILGAVIGYAEMAREDSPKGAKAARYLDKVLEASDRARNLVKQILAFSRQQDSERVSLDPGLIVKEVVKLLRPSLPSTIAISHRIETGRTVLANPTQMHQMLMNLATNAFHAMEQTGGSLEIAIDDIDFGEAASVLHPIIDTGPFVRLSVTDSGSGIPADIKEQIFDPYFTTKEVGKGTGMGLAIVDGIVRGSGGFITCDSEPGKGTVFTIFLPACNIEATATGDEADGIIINSGHILLVDDEEILIEMGQPLLERLGYEVTAHTSSLDALATFQSDPHRFDAVITDQTMPGMTGLDLARRLLQIRPELPIILCTGYSNLVDETTAKAWGIKGFAMKPLTKKEVVVLLNEALGGSSSQ